MTSSRGPGAKWRSASATTSSSEPVSFSSMSTAIRPDAQARTSSTVAGGAAGSRARSSPSVSSPTGAPPTVSSCTVTNTPSAVRRTSNSIMSAPTATPSANAANVFSAARLAPPRWATINGRKVVRLRFPGGAAYGGRPEDIERDDGGRYDDRERERRGGRRRRRSSTTARAPASPPRVPVLDDGPERGRRHRHPGGRGDRARALRRALRSDRRRAVCGWPGGLPRDCIQWQGAAATVDVRELEAYVLRLRHDRCCSRFASNSTGRCAMRSRCCARPASTARS